MIVDRPLVIFLERNVLRKKHCIMRSTESASGKKCGKYEER